MASTYEKIATTTASGSTSDIEFTSISSAYTDLIIVVNGRGATAANTVLLQTYINNDFGSNYSFTRLLGDGINPQSSRGSSQTGGHLGFLPAANSTSGIFGTLIAQYQNYSNSTTNKTVLVRSNSASNVTSYTDASVVLYRSTSAITRIGVATFGVGNYVAGSTFTLYGIKAA